MAIDRKAVAHRALGLLDLTDLNDTSNHEAIAGLCQRAATPHGNVAAICIWPRFVDYVRPLVPKGVTIATVVNFPGGNQGIDMTVAETNAALTDGADEIDLVMPYQALKAGDEATARAMLVAIRTATQDRALLKVIIESGELGSADLIDRASHMAIEAGADFIKTSTGKVAENATLETAERMIQAIADSGAKVGFKPAGGIKTTEDCVAYLDIADRIMGPEWARPSTFRFGASSVLGDLLAALDGKESVAGSGY